MLLCRAALIVEDHEPSRRPTQIGLRLSRRGNQLAGMPPHFGHHAAGPVPALGPVVEADEKAPDILRWSGDRPRELVRDTFRKHLNARQADRVQKTLVLKILLDFRQGEGRIGTEVAPALAISKSADHRLEYLAPAVGRMDIAGTQGAPLDVAELVEDEQGVVAAAAEAAIVGAAFLIALGGIDDRVDVENDCLRSASMSGHHSPFRKEGG